MVPDTPKPSEVEVRRQLDTMLANETFTLRPQQAKFFELIVSAVLAGDEPTEKYIRAKLFPSPPYDLSSNIVRRTADLVRGLLREYYSGPGKDDLVLISLLDYDKKKRVKLQPGQAYTPAFSYNPSHKLATLFTKLRWDISTGHPLKLLEALDIIEEVSAISPENIDIWLLSCELVALLSIYAPMPISDFAETSQEILQEAPLNDPTFPHSSRLYRISAAFHLLNGQLSHAGRQFAEAATLDPLHSSTDLWLPVFYITSGRPKEALSSADSVVRRFPDTAPPLCVSALIHYVVRDFSTADERLTKALTYDPHYWVTYLLKSLVSFQLGRPDLALDHYANAFHFAGTDISLFPGVRHLYISAGLAKFEFSFTIMQKHSFAIVSPSDPFQSGLYSLAEGDKQDAVDSLKEAWTLRNPLTLWLHLWPFLDPLKGFQPFEDLLLETTPKYPSDLVPM
jgi:tetratricopeptide (TPR) repeat protein